MHDILRYKIKSLTIEMNNGKTLSVKNSDIEKKGVRIFKNSKIYSGSFVGEIKDSELLSHTEESAKVGLDYDYEFHKSKEFHHKDANFDNIDILSLKKDVEKMESELDPFRSEFIFNGTMKLTKLSCDLKNSNGTKLVSETVDYDTWYTFKKIGSPNLMDGYFYANGNKFSLVESFKKFAPFLKMYSTEIDLENGEYPIVLVESDSGWYSKLLESFKADKYFEGSCLYAGKMNQKIFSEKFSLYDVSFDKDKNIHQYFDEEGMLRDEPKLPLIENGVFKNVIADLRQAKKYKTKATGNGRRSYNSAVTSGFNALLFQKGTKTFEEIISKLDKCIVSFMAHGGDFTDKGEFSTPIHLGFLVEKGVIKGRIPQVTMTTSLDKMFNESLIDFSSDSFYPSDANVQMFHKVNILKN